MYSYMADAGWFVDCLSGARLPVAQEGDNAALERAYSSGKSMDGAPMLATVEGRVEDRLPMEGSEQRPTLIVDKFISVEAQGCSGPSSTAQLENTYWKLMTLGSDNVATPEGAREIQFVLHSEGHRVAGFSGCNSMMGAYTLEQDKIVFTQMGGTRMFCQNTMDIETRFHQMFSQVATWKISGESLALIDAGGQTLATFESRYMK
jgi:copper homeostasis protein (lipoprotein)